MALISLTTDFGLRDAYVGIIKGVILSICPEARLVDLSHDVPPQNVAQAMHLLFDSVPFFPAGSVHLAVVDPGVGSQRKGMAIAWQGSFLVGPDNGIFTPFLDDGKAFELSRPEYFLDRVSNTFHGRDVFAPVAARLARGLEIEKLGPPIASPVRLEASGPIKEDGGIRGRVIRVDGFGNLVTDITAGMLPAGRFTVEVKDRTVSRRVDFYGEAEPGEPIFLVGSSGRLEVSVVNGSAAELLGAGLEDEVSVVWPDG